MIQDNSTIKISKPIVLVGMMGSGKTHFGRLLGHRLGLNFYDSDTLIEEKAGCSVSEIFDRWGEKKFRDVEASTIQDYLNKGPLVLATGGGAIINADTAKAIFSTTHSVWVRADIRTILSRVSKNRNRPLLQVDNPKAVLQNLIQIRQPIYENARFILDGSLKDTQKTLEQLVSEIYSAESTP
jgi:shikimate kinase